jgi:hypothetical protein
MSKITINDLSDSIELDQQAMAAVIGGTRGGRARQQLRLQREAKARSSMRLLDLARDRRQLRTPG